MGRLLGDGALPPPDSVQAVGPPGEHRAQLSHHLGERRGLTVCGIKSYHFHPVEWPLHESLFIKKNGIKMKKCSIGNSNTVPCRSTPLFTCLFL